MYIFMSIFFSPEKETNRAVLLREAGGGGFQLSYEVCYSVAKDRVPPCESPVLIHETLGFSLEISIQELWESDLS